jgi:hypothetical protein
MKFTAPDYDYPHPIHHIFEKMWQIDNFPLYCLPFCSRLEFLDKAVKICVCSLRPGISASKKKA